MSRRSDELEEDLMLLVGLYVLCRFAAGENRSLWDRYQGAMFDYSDWVNRTAEPIQQQGARAYDAVHDDAAHQQDLPGRQLTKAAVLELATKAGFPDPKLAAAIAMAESGGVTNAIAHSAREFSVGLWQINIYAHPAYSWWDMQDPKKNAAAAYKISRGGTDWRPWTTFATGAYKLFMTGIYR